MKQIAGLSHLTCEVNAKLPYLLGFGVLLAVAACGAPQARTTSHAASRGSTTAPVEASSPPGAPSRGDSAQPAAGQPPPPVIVVQSPNKIVAAVAPDGAALWAFDPASLGLGDVELVAGGPDLLVYAGGSVAAIDRTGVVIGRGSYTKQQVPDSYPAIFPAPGGSRWAWTTLDAAQPASGSTPAMNVSSLWIAGLSEAPHKVRTWTGDYEMSARQWSDAGIVIARLNTTCGRTPLDSMLVDPATGAEKQLFGAGLWPLDVHAGLRVAVSQDLMSIRVAGSAQFEKRYPLPVQQAQVSPSGGRLFVSTFAEQGCGGTAKAATSVVDAWSEDESTVDGFFADAWLDDTHLLGRTLVLDPRGRFGWSDHVQLADLAGHRSDLVLGRLAGVLRN